MARSLRFFGSSELEKVVEGVTSYAKTKKYELSPKNIAKIAKTPLYGRQTLYEKYL